MKLTFTPEEIAFRDEIRAFIEENYPQNLKCVGDREDLTKEDYLSWHRILGAKGWSTPAWPVEYGGPGWNATQKYIFGEELARAETVPVLPFGVNMVAPVIYTFGTPEQKARFLPKIQKGEEWWCQGYSEPGAGSDLAGLSTKAVREGDYYIVNGQKTWTTLAQHADWGFFLVRTDSNCKPQEGISFLLIDMKTPGVEVRPIITMDGAHEVNEVWLTDVKVPVANRVFEENKGWTCAKFLLAHERTGIAQVARSKVGIGRLKKLANETIADGQPLTKDRDFSRKLSELEIDLRALEVTELRVLANEQKGKGPGAESSILKINGSVIQQRITELFLEAVGPYGAPNPRTYKAEGANYAIGPQGAPMAALNYFNVRKTSIYGGSNEIQRNIIAKLVLGL
jgi:hypothetical protein